MPFEEGQMLMANILFLETRSLWPLNLELVISRINPDEFVCLPSLVNIYRQVEDSANPLDEWKKVAIWSFHQALWELADRSSRKGINIVYPRDVLQSEFDRMVLDNLVGPEWADMRKEYVGKSGEIAFEKNAGQ